MLTDFQFKSVTYNYKNTTKNNKLSNITQLFS